MTQQHARDAFLCGLRARRLGAQTGQCQPGLARAWHDGGAVRRQRAGRGAGAVCGRAAGGRAHRSGGCGELGGGRVQHQPRHRAAVRADRGRGRAPPAAAGQRSLAACARGGARRSGPSTTRRPPSAPSPGRSRAAWARRRAEDVHRPPQRRSARTPWRWPPQRDSIARQYRDGFADLFEVGAASDRAAGRGVTGTRRRAARLPGPAGRFPDSHIVRKHGEAVAQTVMSAAQDWHDAGRGRCVLDAMPAFAAWDAELKAAGINPGTTADLTVAALLLASCSRPASGPLTPRVFPAPRPAAWHGS